ncbi:protein FAM72 [Kickxella alabastrina]|uniref:protein FAM72 n=1 Tax=Kickxella alabastrina TaxID=61397 RepID=UPI00221FB7EB|nr:protein FAM72 [Kickxella alabastrina]KAI7835106.1 protein FAM72 [Kickxella alabastrina]
MSNTCPPSNTQQPRTKSACRLYCRYCHNNVCTRGMRALLLADNRIELFSTDMPPMMRIQLVGADYTTRSCRCKIRNVACLGCGNEIGYHITQPCSECLKACNNGHFWMFLTESVYPVELKDPKNCTAIAWLCHPQENEFDELSKLICRDAICR